MGASPVGRAGTTPKAVVWFKVYAAALCAVYVGCAALSLLYFLVDPAELKMEPVEAHIFGALLLVVGAVFAGAFLIPLVLSPRPWLWVYGMVLIGVGMTSLCCLPACIPLLIYWLKPDVKAYFGSS